MQRIVVLVAIFPVVAWLLVGKQVSSGDSTARGRMLYAHQLRRDSRAVVVSQWSAIIYVKRTLYTKYTFVINVIYVRYKRNT